MNAGAGSDGTYGYRRLHQKLVRGGEQAGPELVRELMRELGLVACQPRQWRTTTVGDREQTTTPDLVNRDFTAEQPGRKLVGDITYIRTWAGWLYLATVIDCFNKEVIGYAMVNVERPPGCHPCWLWPSSAVGNHSWSCF
jgi:putative transposase